MSKPRDWYCTHCLSTMPESEVTVLTDDGAGHNVGDESPAACGPCEPLEDEIVAELLEELKHFRWTAARASSPGVESGPRPRIEIRAEPGNIADIRIRVDDHVPADEVWIEQDGIIVHRLRGLAGHPAAALVFSKRCPQCDEFYTDDSSFCEADGAVLFNILRFSPGSGDEASVSRPAAAATAEPPKRELLCERCGREYVVWFAPNDLWNRVVASVAMEFVCPTCFTVAADRAGVSYTAFEIRVEQVSGPDDQQIASADGANLSTQLPSGGSTVVDESRPRPIMDSASRLPVENRDSGTAASPSVPGDGFDVLRRWLAGRVTLDTNSVTVISDALAALLSQYEETKDLCKRWAEAAVRTALVNTDAFDPMHPEGFAASQVRAALAMHEEISRLRTALEAAEADTRALEKWCGLHRSIEITHVVDGYTIDLMEHDGATCRSSHYGNTLAEAIHVTAAAQGATPPTPKSARP